MGLTKPFAFMGGPSDEFTFLLDDYGTDAIAALSVRKLRSDYTGSCLQVTRASDSTTQDIGFVDNLLDTSAISSFCGASEGHVSAWYDQTTGTIYEFARSGVTNSPFIYDGANIITSSNGKPTLEFKNLADNLGTRYLDCDTFGTDYINGKTNFEFDVYTALRSPDGATFHQLFRAEGSGGAERFAFTFRAQSFGQKWQILTDTGATTVELQSTALYTDFTEYLMSYNGSGSNGQIFANTTEVASGSLEGGTYTISEAAIGNDPNGSEPFRGRISEIIFYTVQKTSDRAAISDNINSYYNIY